LKQRWKTHGPGRLRANPEVENVGRARYGKFDECRHVALDLCKLSVERELVTAAETASNTWIYRAT